MLCPQCHGTTSVLETRPAGPASLDVARRRRCNACRHTFSTREWVDNNLVVKKQGTIPPPLCAPVPAPDQDTQLYTVGNNGTQTVPSPDPDWVDAPVGQTYPVLPPPEPVRPLPLPRGDRPTSLVDTRAQLVESWTQPVAGTILLPTDTTLESSDGNDDELHGEQAH